MSKEIETRLRKAITEWGQKESAELYLHSPLEPSSLNRLVAAVMGVVGGDERASSRARNTACSDDAATPVNAGHSADDMTDKGTSKGKKKGKQ